MRARRRSQAALLKPVELSPSADKMTDFAAKFGLTWSQALAEGLVHNAVDACDVLGVQAAELNERWAAAKEGGALFKFGGGFYVGKASGSGVGAGGALVAKSSDILADLPKSIYGGFDALALSNGVGALGTDDTPSRAPNDSSPQMDGSAASAATLLTRARPRWARRRLGEDAALP